MDKHGTSFRLTAEARALLILLAQHYGSAQTTIVELAIRELARREGLWQRDEKGKGARDAPTVVSEAVN